MYLQPPLKELYQRSRLLILDFDQIPDTTPPDESIKHYFEQAEREGRNPRLPENRQEFNDYLLHKTGQRYLVGRYGEDRGSMLAGSIYDSERRTIHLGIDIFCQRLETVHAPCNGTVVWSGRDTDEHGYGYYLIFKPSAPMTVCMLFGHLAGTKLPTADIQVTAGQPMTQIGDFRNGDNGGWSRHLHLQLLTTLPPEGESPDGYASRKDFPDSSKLFPDPMPYFRGWELQTPVADLRPQL